MEELQLRKEEIQVEINGYRGTPGYKEDQRIRLQLRIACFERDIINNKIALINTTNDEERRALEQDQRALEQDRRTQEQLLHDLNVQFQQMQIAQPGNLIFFVSFRFLIFVHSRRFQ
jgi:hypothetical protein